MHLWKHLKAAREKSGLSQEAVGRLFEPQISRAAVAQWEQEDGTEPEAWRLPILARGYNITIDELLGQARLIRQNRSEYFIGNAESGPELRTVPLLSWARAGSLEHAQDPNHAGEGDALIHAARKVGPRAYALKIRGDSMENPGPGRTFPDGCIIIVDPDVEPAIGSFVVARFDGAEEATFKQLVEDAGRRYLKSLNSRYPLLPIDASTRLCGTWVQTIIDSD